ncbi:MAG: CHAT domain-containing protein [Bacteroidetes bacterium]|nr:CHAT domain-containing protein [Bacteroidota bacterium]
MTRIRKEDTLSYDHFWSPLKKHLKGIKTVYFSPDGVFNSLNLQTLYNPDKKKYLMEEVDVRIVTSTKDLLAAKSPTMPYNYVILMGNPDFGQEAQLLANRNINTTTTLDSLARYGISALPGTKIEIENLSELFQQKGWREDVWTEKDATEDHLKNMRKPKVLHIATHGFFEPDDDEHTYQNNPLYRSGLLLSGAEKVFQNNENIRGNTQIGKEDGVLTAFEAMNLNIENTELVVLSACETGLGEIRNGEGVYGLQRAFQVAGARSLMISLWKVSDQVTQELMVDFYTNWLGGMSKREALKKTQLMLKEKYKSPFYWGAFVLIGE